jgi:transcriptional regulator with XRE-family HTH domain
MMNIFLREMLAPDLRPPIFIQVNATQLAHFIRARRRTLGLDQRALAEIAGLSVHSLSDIESGKGNPTLAILSQLGTALGLELTFRLRQPGGDSGDAR